MAHEKILIIEDNEMNFELVNDLLEMNKYLVIKAETAEDGIKLAQSETPRLILMDINLPGMDGLTATRILKSDESTKNIPVIAMTAFAMREDVKRIYDAGCEKYITKPINTREFLAIVQDYINKR